MKRSDLKEDDYKIYLGIIGSYAVNYNENCYTQILFPMIILPCLYFQLVAQSKIKFDPYTKEPLKDDANWIPT